MNTKIKEALLVGLHLRISRNVWYKNWHISRVAATFQNNSSRGCRSIGALSCQVFNGHGIDSAGMNEKSMLTSSTGNIFRLTDPLCGKFTDHRWIPLTMASDAKFDVSLICALNKRLSKQSRGWPRTAGNPAHRSTGHWNYGAKRGLAIHLPI